MRKAETERRYHGLCERLDLPKARESEVFYANRQQAEQKQAAIEAEQKGLQDRRVDLQVDIRQLHEADQRLEKELESLRTRQSNIDRDYLQIRARLCETLGFEEEDLPFAGELLQVQPEASDWEGAIERLLRNFGLSLLVDERHYHAIARYVDRTHLKGRLVIIGFARMSRAVTNKPAPAPWSAN